MPGMSCCMRPASGFLFYWKDRQAWHIGDDYTTSAAGLVTPKCVENTGTSCPDEASAWTLERPDDSSTAWWEWDDASGKFVEGVASVSTSPVSLLLLQTPLANDTSAGNASSLDSQHTEATMKLDDDDRNSN